MTWRTLLMALLLVASASAAGPAEAITSAAKDLASQPEESRHAIRYLTDHAVPEKQRGNFERVLRFHLNSLSREAELVNPVIVAPDVYRIHLDEYGIDPATWEKLRFSEPYFTVRVEKKVNGKIRTVRATAPHLPAGDMAYLIRETGSAVPIVRADWFWSQTVVQEQRRAGYYDFLGLKNRFQHYWFI